MPIVRLVALLLFTVAMTVSLTQAAARFVPSDQLTFSANIGGRNGLYLYDITHHQLHCLIADTAPSTALAWSSDGTQLAYVDAEGVANRSETLVIFDTRSRTARTVFPDALTHGDIVYPPVWSPDGSHIAFTFAALRPMEGSALQLVMLRLSDNHISVQALPGAAGRNHALRWLDEARLRYVEINRRSVKVYDIPAQSLALAAVDEWSVDFARYEPPVVSHNGSHIVVAAITAPRDEYQLFSFDVSHPTPSTLTYQSGVTEMGASWSSDSSQIAYLRYANGGPSVIVKRHEEAVGHSVDGHVFGRISPPVWSSDNHRLVYARSQAGGFRLCVANSTSSEVACFLFVSWVGDIAWR
jgi:Tol biopolymer transport system component